MTSNKISTRQLVSMAMLGAISIVLVSAIHFPLIPAAAFLEYDPADIPILICAFAYGPTAGFLLTVVGGCPSTGGLQSPCVSQAVQDSALLQHPEADLSRGGEGPARGLEESEVGVSRAGRGTSSHILGRSLLTHLWGPSLLSCSPPPGFRI